MAWPLIRQNCKESSTRIIQTEVVSTPLLPFTRIQKAVRLLFNELLSVLHLYSSEGMHCNTS